MMPHISFIAGSYNARGSPIPITGEFAHIKLEEQVIRPTPNLELRVYGLCLAEQSLDTLVSNVAEAQLVLSGKIYNLKELSGRVGRHLDGDRSLTPAEVFMHLYILDKEWLLQNINGKFCAAIHQDDKLTLIRDKVGEEQLYYGFSPSRVMFSSAIKDIILGLGLSEFLIPDSLVVFETPIEDETMFKGVHKVESGTEITINLKNLQTAKRTYWKPEPRPITLPTEEAYVEAFLALMNDAVRKRLPQGNFGISLSGGQDSSFLSCVLSQQGKTPNRAYTTAWLDLDPVYNEVLWASIVAKHVGADHVILQPSADDFRLHYPRTMRIFDEVKANAAHFTEYWIAKEAAQRGDTHLFSGYGADELLGGEVRYLIMALDRQRKCNTKRYRSHPLLKQYTYLWQQLKGVPADTPEDYKYFHLMKRGTVGERDGVLAAKVTAQFKRFIQLIDQMGATDIAITGQPLLDSVKINKYWGIDKVCPFLDSRVYEFAFGIPENLKLSGLSTKRILRLASRGLVPEEIMNRPTKIGFAFPHNTPQYLLFLQGHANDLEKRLGRAIAADPTRARYDRTTLMAASHEILRKLYEDRNTSILEADIK